jgi:hypothetical protein
VNELVVLFFKSSDGFSKFQFVVKDSLSSSMDFIFSLVELNSEVIKFLGVFFNLFVVNFNSGFFIFSFINGSFVQVGCKLVK